ncbi:MAG: hypothetical protein U0835_06155 [Isosphaeraceae bacterium]
MDLPFLITADPKGLATLSRTIVDPGGSDSFVLAIDWGDGTAELFDFPAGTTTFSKSTSTPALLPTTEPGFVPLHVRVTDDDGDSSG